MEKIIQNMNIIQNGLIKFMIQLNFTNTKQAIKIQIKCHVIQKKFLMIK
jgi:hypothetical protein